MARPPRRPPSRTGRTGDRPTPEGSRAGARGRPTRRKSSQTDARDKDRVGQTKSAETRGSGRGSAAEKGRFNRKTTPISKTGETTTHRSHGKQGDAKQSKPSRTRNVRDDATPRTPRTPQTVRTARAKPIDPKRIKPNGPPDPMRIAKAIARAGVCSRRDAERMIEGGLVIVNGRRLADAALNVGPADRIVVDGAPLPLAEPPQLWRYHKPKGRMTTHRDPQGRPTVFEALPDDMPRVISIGRLDFNTEGLLLLTTDGALARHLELPSTGWLRRYRVRALGSVKPEQLAALADGVVVDGVSYGPIEAEIDSVQGANTWLTIGLREGKNREVRKVLGSLDLTVNRLIRVSYGPFQLLDMKPGEVELVRRKTLIGQLGPSLSETFGLTATADTSTRSDGPPRSTAARRRRKPPGA
ncbi:MAG: pseudouridine synthase [Pseudomonadota bacterium]